MLTLIHCQKMILRFLIFGILAKNSISSTVENEPSETVINIYEGQGSYLPVISHTYGLYF